MKTKGQIYAGIRNHMEPAHVDQVRAPTAALIDFIEQWSDSEDESVRRAIAIAQTKYEEACMMAVKALYLSETEK